MIVLNLDEYNIHKKTILDELKKTVFVYPTDTIYGIGCNACDEKLISKIRKLKNSDQPFSIIVPSKEWIYQNCVVTAEAEEWIRKLPGPYTLILKLKNPKAVAKNVYHQNQTIGVRMPNHWFLAVVYQMRIPIVTTSANVSGRDFMTSLEDLDSSIRNNVDYVFYEGEKRGRPSTMINLVGPEVSIRQRTESSSLKEKSVNIKFPLKEIEM
ncbi:MAG: L-threonylcarbamoyladenylate synthase [Candidatus Woesearchaeota archaeon]